MKKILLIALLLLVIIPGSVSYAQEDENPSMPVGNNANPSFPVGNDAPAPKPPTTSTPAQKLENPLRVDSIEAVIFLAVDIMIYVGVAFAILAIIFVGFKFVMAQGNSDKLTEAKQWFLYIIIGLAVLISAKVIVEIVENTLIESGVVNEDFWRP